MLYGEECFTLVQSFEGHMYPVIVSNVAGGRKSRSGLLASQA